MLLAMGLCAIPGAVNVSAPNAANTKFASHATKRLNALLRAHVPKMLPGETKKENIGEEDAVRKRRIEVREQSCDRAIGNLHARRGGNRKSLARLIASSARLEELAFTNMNQF